MPDENEKHNVHGTSRPENKQQSKGWNGDVEDSDPVKQQHHSSLPSKVEVTKSKVSDQKAKAKEKTAPAGGWSDTPIPPAQDGYTVKFVRPLLKATIESPINDDFSRHFTGPPTFPLPTLARELPIHLSRPSLPHRGFPNATRKTRILYSEQ